MRRRSRCTPLASSLAAALCLTVAGPGPALAASEVTLSAEEVEALQLRLVEAKPNLATVAIASFVFPGAAQAHMGHVDHTLALWGGYLAAYTAAKALVPEAPLGAGQRVSLSDWLVLGAFITMASVSAVDAYWLAQARRQAYDALINRLSDKTAPLSPEAILPVTAPSPEGASRP